jgi:CBS domain-containing protein/anti-sigma regulatory factor (Ser/Thr protein kinase)
MSRRARRKVRIQKVQELSYELRVREAMNKKILTLNPRHTVVDVREILKKRKISGMPIVEKGRLLGIISIEDLINCMASGTMDKGVTDIMTEKVVVLFSDEPLISAIYKFDRYGYGRFPVVDRESGKLVGIITKQDIIRCLLKTLEALYHAEEDKGHRRYNMTSLFTDLPSDNTILTLKYHVPGGDFKKAGERSDQLKENLLTLGYANDHIRRLIIAVLEAEMNLAIFTPGGDIIARIEPGKITVNVIDKGPGIADIALAMQPGYSTAPDFIRELGFGAGMGLPNIKRCTDEMKIDSRPGKGTNLEFSIGD